jgi:membrane protein YdbS with pleckstrin-like domain
LPRNGVVIDIPGLNERARETFRQEVRRYARACGCSIAGATFLLSSAACTVYSVHLVLNHAWVSFGRTIVAAIISVPTLTIAAKFLSLWFARHRFRRSCARLIASLPANAGIHDTRRTAHGL